MHLNAPGILLVEDNLDDELLMLRAIQRNQIHHPVTVVHSGQEALDYLFAMGKYCDRDTQQMPQLILMDVQLPRMNGIEVLKRIRRDERTTCIPVIMLSSSNHEQDRLDSYRFFANSYLQKPAEFKKLLETVKQIGQYWLGLNQAPPLNPSDHTANSMY
jgi:two-component system, response regulator